MNSVETIYQEMCACFQEQTGMEQREGCDLPARMYALAAQVYALHVQSDWVVRQAFPQTAQEGYLDYHAQLRGLERKQGVAAQGVVQFTAGESVETDRVIPQGTVCMTVGLVRFETTQNAILAAGNTVVAVPVRAMVAGTSGNAATGGIITMAVAPMGIAQCTNTQPCAGGMDEEGDEALRERVLATFQRLPNGANGAFYQQGALSFDQVAAAQVIARPRGIGTVDVVVATQTGVPEQALLDELRDYFQQRREIAVDVQVRAPQTVTVNVNIKLAVREGWDFTQVAAAVKEAIYGWFTGKLLGQNVLRAQLGSIVYGCDGVTNYTITTPAADSTIAVDVLPVLGTLTVEAMA